MWETRLGVERNECLEAAKGSWGRMEESTMGVGEASPTAEVILSFWAWVSLSSRASQFHTLVFLSAWGPQVSAALYLAPPVSTLDSTARCRSRLPFSSHQFNKQAFGCLLIH